MLTADVRQGETDVLSGHEHEDLRIVDLEGNELVRLPSTTGWTVPLLHDAISGSYVQAALAASFGGNYYLGDQWIGGTEV